MFTQFSAHLYQLAAAEEYRMINQGEMTTETISPHWIMRKHEMATVIDLHVVDSSKINWTKIIETSHLNNENAKTIMDQCKQVASIYVLFGGEIPDWQNAEAYFGQKIYSVFWHVDAEGGKISAPKGQPKKLFGLNTLVEKAFVAIDETVDISGFGKHIKPLQPQNKYPIITGALIAINLTVLVFMVLSGFPNDFWVPRTFGAIYPPWVFEYGQWWRLFTAMFVHFGWAHLGANTFGLIVFGSRVEKYLGRIAFCLIYLLAGLLGSVFSIFISTAYSAGASGAIYGLIGALFIFTRLTKRSIEFINWYLMFTYIGIGIAMGFATPGIDNAGHVGGLIGGVIIGWIYVKLT